MIFSEKNVKKGNLKKGKGWSTAAHYAVIGDVPNRLVLFPCCFFALVSDPNYIEFYLSLDTENQRFFSILKRMSLIQCTKPDYTGICIVLYVFGVMRPLFLRKVIDEVRSEA